MRKWMLLVTLLACLGKMLCAPELQRILKQSPNEQKKFDTLLDLCVSSLRRGHANLLCIVPILSDDPRRESSRKSIVSNLSNFHLMQNFG